MLINFKYKFLFSCVLALVAMFFISGCGSTPAPSSVSQTPTAAPEKASQQVVNAETYLAKIKFKTEDGKEAVVIKRYTDHDKIELDYAGSKSVFKGRTDKKDRVKYKESTEDGNEKAFLTEVKIKDQSIKLVDENEKLLWKIKISDDKIKISDNEDGNNSCEIKIKSAEKGEIRDQAGNEIGNVRFYSDNQKLKVKDGAGKEILVSKDLMFSAAPGVIMFEHIPVKFRAVIISELLRAGK